MVKPKEPIRRFDVFAEYSRQEATKDGLTPKQAKGYGIWLAKVVAARRFSRAVSESSKTRPTSKSAPETEQHHDRASPWRTLNGIPQTDALFDQEIVQRMGKTFYDRVFFPAIRKAFKEGLSYTNIRDKIRKDWKP